MMEKSNLMGLKHEICEQICTMLDKRMEALQKDIASTKEARNADTKSSAGDKFETGREMMQIELQKAENQLHKNMCLKNEVLKINPSKKYQKVEFGALVKTNNGTYFIAVALGKITVQNQVAFVLSLASPIGKVLFNKAVGDTFTFQGKLFCIEEVG